VLHVEACVLIALRQRNAYLGSATSHHAHKFGNRTCRLLPSIPTAEEHVCIKFDKMYRFAVFYALIGVAEARARSFIVQSCHTSFATLQGRSYLLPYDGILELRGGASEDLKPKKSKRKKRKSKSQTESRAKLDLERKPLQSERKTASRASSAEKSSKTSKVMKRTTLPKRSPAADAHLQAKLKSTSPNYRIQRELKAFLSDPPSNLSVKVGKNLRVWIVSIEGAKGTVYEGEIFKLRISFPPQYPTVPPSVYFLPPSIPVHEHVYTNGDICLSLLGKDWRPTMTAQSIAVSILSILSSAQSKSLPMDNARHAQNKPGEYQKDWVYHDDNC
jgi:ubiquitin-conjugating enzyme E2 W